MARTVTLLTEDELKYVAAIAGEATPVSDETAYLLALYYQSAEEALLKRRYPFGYTEEQAENAKKFYSENIEKAFIDKWNKIGADNEASHSEAGVSRTYLDFEKYFLDVVPVAKVM